MEEKATRFKARERGTASRVPAVPGIHGKYPVPAPVTKNKMSFCRLGMRRGSQLCEEELLGVVENPPQVRLDSIFRRNLEL